LLGFLFGLELDKDTVSCEISYGRIQMNDMDKIERHLESYIEIGCADVFLKMAMFYGMEELARSVVRNAFLAGASSAVCIAREIVSDIEEEKG
jgi:hypothetical protein